MFNKATVIYMSYIKISTAKNVYSVVVLICYHWVKNKLPSIFPNILRPLLAGPLIQAIFTVFRQNGG